MNCNEIDCKENDNDDVSEEDSYVKYCEKINECERYDASYARWEDIDSDGDDKYFVNVIKRKMEPLRIGDIIKYQPHFDIGNTGNDEEGMIINIAKRERQIMTSNMDVLDRMGVVKRIGCYDANQNLIEPQDGVRRNLPDFKLCNEASDELKRNLTEKARQRLHDRLRVSLKNMKQKIKLLNPSLVDFISNKSN